MITNAVMAGGMGLVLVAVSALFLSITGSSLSPCEQDDSDLGGLFSIIDKAQPCQRNVCDCYCSALNLVVYCDNQNLTVVPANMSDFTGLL